MDNYREEFYKKKYLKYKAKYLEAKNELEGGLGLCQKCSFYIYFFSSNLFNKDTKSGVLDFLKNKSDPKYIELSEISSGCDFDKKLYDYCDGKGVCGYLEIKTNDHKARYKSRKGSYEASINIIKSKSSIFNKINYEQLDGQIYSYDSSFKSNQDHDLQTKPDKEYNYDVNKLKLINEKISKEGFGNDWFYIIKSFPCKPFYDQNGFAGSLKQYDKDWEEKKKIQDKLFLENYYKNQAEEAQKKLDSFNKQQAEEAQKN